MLYSPLEIKSLFIIISVCQKENFKNVVEISVNSSISSMRLQKNIQMNNIEIHDMKQYTE